MKRIIALSGDIGGGKSSVATALQQLTGYEMIGTGAIQRAIAKQRGMTTLELNQISQTDRSVDDEIDHYVINLGQTRDELIIDSRLAWHFIPSAFKVFLTVEPLIGAQRVFNAKRSEEHNPSLDITLDNNAKRQAMEDERFYKLYNIRFKEQSNYDFVVDTSHNAPEQIAAQIQQQFLIRLQNQ